MSKANHPFFSKSKPTYDYGPGRKWAQKQPTAPSEMEDDGILKALQAYSNRRDNMIPAVESESGKGEGDSALLGPEEKEEAERLDAFRKEEEGGREDERDVETAEARSAAEMARWAEDILPLVGDTKRLAEAYLRPCQQLLLKHGIQQGRKLYTLRNDKLSPAFPWLSGLTRKLYDTVVGRDIPYWFLVLAAAAAIDPSIIGLLNHIRDQSSFQEVRRYLISSPQPMGEFAEPCCYALSPDVEAEYIKVYIGMAQNPRTRLNQHMQSNVNSRMAMEAERIDKQSWTARVWFAETRQIGDQYLPIPARHFIEHIAIVAAGSTLVNHHPLQQNVMDRIRAITLVSAADVASIIRILDVVLSQGHRLPGGMDFEGWQIALASVLPPGSEVSMNTLCKAMKGVHRPHILNGMDPAPKFWLEHINSPEEDTSQMRSSGFSDSPLPATGRPVSESAVAAHDQATIGGRVTRHSPYTHVGLLEKLAAAVRLEGEIRGINK